MGGVAQERLPTVAALRGMSSAELEQRRLVLLQAERAMRTALIALAASAIAIVVTLSVLIASL